MIDDEGMKLSSIFNFLLAIPSSLAGGYVFAQLWNWFVIRKFPGLPALDFLDAVGLLMVISFPLFGIFWADMIKDAKREGKSDAGVVAAIGSVIKLVIIYPLMYGIAYLWHLVIG